MASTLSGFAHDDVDEIKTKAATATAMHIFFIFFFLCLCCHIPERTCAREILLAICVSIHAASDTSKSATLESLNLTE
jgi:hypothetical protein